MLNELGGAPGGEGARKLGDSQKTRRKLKKKKSGRPTLHAFDNATG